VNTELVTLYEYYFRYGILPSKNSDMMSVSYRTMSLTCKRLYYTQPNNLDDQVRKHSYWRSGLKDILSKYVVTK
jgi:hypothetical protein